MRRASLILVALLLVAGCRTAGSSPDDNAVADLKNAAGQTVGIARLVQSGNAVSFVLEVRGLPPGDHGVHVHTVGKCDPPDFTSAGGHFNPTGAQHGALNAKGPHAGDMPNLTVAPDGTGHLETSTEQLSLAAAGPLSIWDADGAAVVIHAAKDDFKTDPTGNSGARIACGVLAKPAR